MRTRILFDTARRVTYRLSCHPRRDTNQFHVFPAACDVDGWLCVGDLRLDNLYGRQPTSKPKGARSLPDFPLLFHYLMAGRFALKLSLHCPIRK